MNEPWKLWVKPAALKPYRNGELPATALERIPSGGTGIVAYQWTKAAASFKLMFAAAKADGIQLRSTGKQYRPLKAQEALFYERMSPTPTDRKPPVKRRYKGQWWWLKRGKAPVASPGQSVHGWACAVDLDVRNRKVYEWLCANGPRFGWYLAGPRSSPSFEPWHWQYNP
jgi:D-alanyl-D-alanine carboxypeptidase